MSKQELPSLVIVAGRPGAGKTTLAKKLARDIHCPLVSRDAIKEGVVNTIGDKGEPGGPLTWRVYETFFANIELLLRNQVTLVAEAAFQHKNWAPKLEPLAKVAHLRIVLCQIDPVLANTRVQQRRENDKSWDRFHNKTLDQVKQAPKAYDPPRLNHPTLAVDSSDQYNPNFKEILAFAQSKT